MGKILGFDEFINESAINENANVLKVGSIEIVSMKQGDNYSFKDKVPTIIVDNTGVTFSRSVKGSGGSLRYEFSPTVDGAMKTEIDGAGTSKPKETLISPTEKIKGNAYSILLDIFKALTGAKEVTDIDEKSLDHLYGAISKIANDSRLKTITKSNPEFLNFYSGLITSNLENSLGDYKYTLKGIFLKRFKDKMDNIAKKYPEIK